MHESRTASHGRVFARDHECRTRDRSSHTDGFSDPLRERGLAGAEFARQHDEVARVQQRADAPTELDRGVYVGQANVNRHDAATRSTSSMR